MRVLGIGNALVDQLILIDQDQILNELSLPKGSMQMVDAATSAAVSEAAKAFPSSMASGGSAANTIRGLAKLGTKASFIGHVGEDEVGDFFRDDLVESGAEAILFTSETPSGIAKAFVSIDGERTFATYLGAALELSADHLIPELFTGYGILYIEGYLIFNEPLIRKAMDLAKASGIKIALDLASYNVVEVQRDLFAELIEKYVDIVFANEEEAKALTGLEPAGALKHLAERCDYAIVKTGSKGSLIAHNGQTETIKAFPVTAIDTTAAGDMYAAGFLHGLGLGWSTERSGRTGSFLASRVIGVVGAKMENSLWDEIYQQLPQL